MNARVMAEVGMAHDGSLMAAHAYIDAVAEAGADAVKFQCHIAEAESTPDEPWRVEPKWPTDRNRYEYWKRLEFNAVQWNSLAAHAAANGLEFVVSPFSVEAVNLLKTQVDAWKVASGEVTHGRLLDAIRVTEKPIYLSSGMSTEAELGAAYIGLRPREITVMQCTSIYPCPPEMWGLGHILALRKKYPKVGYSDHSGTIVAPVAAVVYGAELVEVHVCFDKRQGGFDVESSLTIDELGELCDAVSALNRAGDVPKDEMAEQLSEMRRIFGDKWKRKAGLIA